MTATVAGREGDSLLIDVSGLAHDWRVTVRFEVRVTPKLVQITGRRVTTLIRRATLRCPRSYCFSGCEHELVARAALAA